MKKLPPPTNHSTTFMLLAEKLLETHTSPMDYEGVIKACKKIRSRRYRHQIILGIFAGINLTVPFQLPTPGFILLDILNIAVAVYLIRLLVYNHKAIAGFNDTIGQLDTMYKEKHPQ